MYIIPNQVNLAIVPSQISPVGVVAAILKMAAMSPLSQKLRARRAIIVDSIYRLLGVDLRKSSAEYIMLLYPPVWRSFF